ncbi:hypothetical protein [Phyllobacterium ifriqiyense]|uniref:hypothetical protein n=1 Tax=Phyllobacterium ifriqiyense TaxID=314238 RepID=UPI003398BC3D
MADRPILFSAPMVRALLEGRKTQTRRIIKPRGHASLFDGTWSDSYVLDPGNALWRARDVRFKVGDRLYVREAWRVEARLDKKAPRDIKTNYPGVKYIATDEPDFFGIEGKYRQAMHMPRWASRITLLVTDVRVERLQDCSEEDAIAEGIFVIPINDDVRSNFYDQDWAKALPDNTIFYSAPDDDDDHCMRLKAVEAYERLWNSINDERGLGWETNPWVVAVTFEVLKQNIDEVV